MTKVKMPVANWMTEKVIVATTEHSFTQVKEVFLKHRMHHLPVVDGDELVGIISSYDLLKAYDQQATENVSVADAIMDSLYPVSKIMTSNPDFIGSDEELELAIDKMRSGGFQALPVVNNKRVVGILTNNDVIKYAKIMLTD